MKILIRNSDNVVIYAQDDLVLDDEAHGNSWRDQNFNTENAILTDAVLPDLWTGAVWSYTGGAWAVVDTVRHDEIVANEQAKKALTARQDRNDKLKDSDWTQLIDSLADKATWAIYRKALRDISAQTGFPSAIVWPTQP